MTSSWTPTGNTRRRWRLRNEVVLFGEQSCSHCAFQLEGIGPDYRVGASLCIPRAPRDNLAGVPDHPEDAGAIEIPIGCPDCGGLLTALVGSPQEFSAPLPWTCPYCQKSHGTDFGGRLYWVVKKSHPAARD